MPPRFSDLSVERHFTNGVESERYKIGIMGGNVSSIGEWTTEAVTWEGASLIIRRGKYSGPPQQTKPNAEREESGHLIEPDGFDHDQRSIVWFRPYNR